MVAELRFPFGFAVPACYVVVLRDGCNNYTVLKGWKVPLQNIKKSENFRLLKSYTIVLGSNHTIIKNIKQKSWQFSWLKQSQTM